MSVPNGTFVKVNVPYDLDDFCCDYCSPGEGETYELEYAIICMVSDKANHYLARLPNATLKHSEQAIIVFDGNEFNYVEKVVI